MSLYTQNGYGQVLYGAPSYAQPSGYYQVPPPAPYYHVDPNAFRRDFSSRLAELTVNSRPIIQSLSMIAQEYTRFSEIVAQCLEAHIRRVPPWIKLPAFYLLDAISKNVYDPYARQFAPFVTALFLETYAQVDQNTRSKMEEMLMTWRTGGANGKELFGVVPQLSIERGVWGGDSDPTSSFYSGSGQITKSQVLSELEFVLGQKERTLLANPFDTASQNHINILQQLRKLVQAGGVSQEELRQILERLRSFSQSAVPPPSRAPPPPSAPVLLAAPAYPGTTYSHGYSSQPAYPTLDSQPHFSAHGGQPSYPQPPKTDLPTSSSQGASSASTSLAAPINNITNLYNALLKAGVVSATGTPTGAGETAKVEEIKPQPVDPAKAAAREYRKAILSQNVKLTSTGITKTRPEILRFLYDRMPVQCKQCGVRFADNPIGKKEMQDHLDMHFRQNRKANQNIGRGHSRSWFVALEDWTHDVLIDVKGKGRSRPLNAKAAAAAEAAKREAELRALYVVVPPGDEAKPISCPICKELLKSEFLEDDEEWVWKNAIKKEDRVFHATCHAEAVTSTNSLAARLRNEMANASSRSGTPEVHSSRSTPPKHTVQQSSLSTIVRASHSPTPQSKLSGTKRKVEDEDTSISAEAEGSPPAKKIAIES